jgi:hypothetical protein
MNGARRAAVERCASATGSSAMGGVGSAKSNSVQAWRRCHSIDDRRLAFPRRSEQIAAEAALDGIYILRTSTESKAAFELGEDREHPRQRPPLAVVRSRPSERDTKRADRDGSQLFDPRPQARERHPSG